MTYGSEERREVPMEIGRLTYAIETLTGEVNMLRTKVESIEGQVNRGKGVMAGMFLAAGGIGASIASVFHKVFGNGGN